MENGKEICIAIIYRHMLNYPTFEQFLIVMKIVINIKSGTQLCDM